MDLTSLPTELILEIVSHVPVLDYYNLKQVGSPRITAAVRQVCASLPRGTYLSELALEDERRRGPGAPRRRAMEIMVARGQHALVAHYERRYSPTGEEKRTVPGSCQIRGDMWLDEEKRSFRLAVHWAAYYGSRNIVESLLDRIHLREGKHGRTPLHFAALGQLEIAEFLLRHGAYVNALDYRGRTPLGISISVDKGQQSNADVTRLLRAHGGKVDIFEVLDGDEDWVKVYLDDQTSYKQFVKAAKHLPWKLVERFRVLRMWREYRRKAPIRNRRELELRRWKIQNAALESGFAAIFFVTLRTGMDINAPVDKKIGGGTALHWAVRKRHYPMMRALLQRGADPNCDLPPKLTPWELVVNNHDVTATQIFLDWNQCERPRRPLLEPSILTRVLACTMISEHKERFEWLNSFHPTGQFPPPAGFSHLGSEQIPKSH